MKTYITTFYAETKDGKMAFVGPEIFAESFEEAEELLKTNPISQSFEAEVEGYLV